MNSLRQLSRSLRKSWYTLMLRILTKLSVSLLSLSESSLLQKIWEEWQGRSPMRLRLPSLNNSDRGQPQSSEVTPGQAERLRLLTGTEGFKLLQQHLDLLSEEVSEYLLEAEEPADFKYRKGFLDGHNRTKNLIYTLISLGEEGEAVWMAKELEKGLAPFRMVGLPRGQAEPEEVVDRISRVLRAVERERQEQKDSTGANSTQP